MRNSKRNYGKKSERRLGRHLGRRRICPSGILLMIHTSVSLPKVLARFTEIYNRLSLGISHRAPPAEVPFGISPHTTLGFSPEFHSSSFFEISFGDPV